MKKQRLEILQSVFNRKLTPEQADTQLLDLSIVKIALSEYVKKKQEEAWDKMGDTGNYDYGTEKMNWNEENFWFGYYRALEDLEDKFL